MWHYYKFVSNDGFGDTYYVFERSRKEALERAGLDSPETKARGGRCSKREAVNAKITYGIHKIGL